MSLPIRISRCHDGGYHANGAGPCFETVEQAVAHRDREDDEWRRRLNGEVWRYPHLKARYDAEGWPDGREVIGENGEPKLLYRIERDGIKVAASTRDGAAKMFDRILARRTAASTHERGSERGVDA